MHERTLTRSQISITTPPHLHRDMSIQALKAGKHVMCDKPTCLNRAEGTSWRASGRVSVVLLMSCDSARHVPRSSGISQPTRPDRSRAQVTRGTRNDSPLTRVTQISAAVHPRTRAGRGGSGGVSGAHGHCVRGGAVWSCQRVVVGRIARQVTAPRTLDMAR